MLSFEKKQQIHDSLRNLAETHAAAVAQTESAIAILVALLELEESELARIDSVGLPCVNEATFSVTWGGRTCFLGNTLLFWLFWRLASTPNQYVTHEELLETVWKQDRHESSIRGVVKRLRDQLRRGGMPDLADAINGTVTGCYALILAKKIEIKRRSNDDQTGIKRL